MSDSNLETDGQTTSYEGEAANAGQPAASQESITDLLTEPLTQAYVKAIVAIYAVLGAGMGLIVLFNDVIDEPLIDGGLSGAAATISLGSIPISGVPHIAATIALLVGGYLGVRMAADDRQTMLTGAAGTLAGTVVLWLLSSFLAASQMDDVSVEAGNLLINAVVLGLVVGGVAAGTVYVMRNLVPDVQESSA